MKKFVMVCEKCNEVWCSDDYATPYNRNFHAKEIDNDKFCGGNVFCLVGNQKIKINKDGLIIELSEREIRLIDFFSQYDILFKTINE